MQHTPTSQQDKQYSFPCPKPFSWEANVGVQLGLEPESSPAFQAGSSTARMDSLWSCLSQAWTPRATAALKGTPNVISLMVNCAQESRFLERTSLVVHTGNKCCSMAFIAINFSCKNRPCFYLRTHGLRYNCMLAWRV